MAIVFMEGFDTYNGTGGAGTTSVGAAIRWSGNYFLSTGRFGGQCIASSGSPTAGVTNAWAPIGNTYTASTVGVAVLISSTPSAARPFLSFSQGSALSYGAQFHLRVNTDLSISAYRNATVLGTTATNVITPTAWQYIEVEFVISDTVGSINVYVSGTSVLSLSNINNKNQAASGYNFLYLSSGDNSGLSSGTWSYYDDIYITDSATRLGEQRIVTLNANGDSSPSQWTSSNVGAAAYTMIDEVLCNADTDYVYAGTVDYRAMFAMGDLPTTPDVIKGVQLGAYTRKTDTGLRTVNLQYEGTGTSTYTSAQFTLGSSYTRQLDILGTNPLTSTTWTGSDINAMKVGVKVAS